jgi:hypothetical protein
MFRSDITSKAALFTSGNIDIHECIKKGIPKCTSAQLKWGIRSQLRDLKIPKTSLTPGYFNW